MQLFVYQPAIHIKDVVSACCYGCRTCCCCYFCFVVVAGVSVISSVVKVVVRAFGVNFIIIIAVVVTLP